MVHPLGLALTASLALGAAARAVSGAAPQLDRRLTETNGFYNASAGGGSWLTIAPDTNGLGEPLNVVISGESDAYVLTTEGFLDFMLSVQMGGECLGQHIGDAQTANLGDGNGYLNQTSELRYDYGYNTDATIGTCIESIKGGNHLRYWTQNGASANSGAIFMAVSREQNESTNHDIYLPDGYAAGRDELTGNATVANGTISAVTNRTYSTTNTYLEGYIQNGSTGVNHGIALDGKLALWVVRVTGNGSDASASPSSSSTSAGSVAWQSTSTAARIATILLTAGTAILCL